MSQSALDEYRRARSIQSDKNDARTIRAKVNDARKGSNQAALRWPFELLQNAHDAGPRSGRAEITVGLHTDGTKFIFEHDGAPFSPQELTALLSGGSSKDFESTVTTGRFGTGFLSTHVLSTQARLIGLLRAKTGLEKFDLVLDRAGDEDRILKTGAPDDAHKFQVRVYALLWSLDEELNPARRPVDSLVLAYESGDVSVRPPNVEELAMIEKELGESRAAAEASLIARPPEARPSPENCRYCGVRQLCDKYWSAESVPKAAAERFGDVELKIQSRHGPSSWDAVVLLSSAASVGKPALLRTQQAMELNPGMRIRVLDAVVAVDREDEAQPVIVTLGMFSEMFAVV